MKEPSPETVQSVRQRLLNRAQERREDFQFTLVRFGVERFLYRLSQSPYSDRYVVKGATLFTVWLDEPHRSTRDLDLNWLQDGTREEAEVHLRRIFHYDCPEDGLLFDPSTLALHSIRGAQENQGLRAKFLARLGRAKIPLQVDIGFGDVISPPPRVEEFPSLLDLPRPQVRLYPQETFIAEKFEAMVRLGSKNSRYKDFSDVALLASHKELEGSKLREATEKTFRHRRTPVEIRDRPIALGPSFYSDEERGKDWKSFVEENPLVESLGSFPKVGELLILFLRPLWEAMALKAGWAMIWEPRGPWREE